MKVMKIVWRMFVSFLVLLVLPLLFFIVYITPKIYLIGFIFLTAIVVLWATVYGIIYGNGDYFD